MKRLSVSQASQVLGVTQQAVHGRIKRDTIEHEIGEDGKIYVYLTDNETRSQSIDNTVVEGVVNDYITSLKSEIETLKTHTKSLEHDREEWKEEARRKDTIIMALTNRIPELEAPSEATEGPVTASNGESRRVVPPEPENRSWWRRIFAP